MINRLKILLVLISLGLTWKASYSQSPIAIPNDTINQLRNIVNNHFHPNDTTKELRNVVNNYFHSRQNKEPISLEMLNSATKTTYSFNNFPCPDPTSEYQGYVHVTPELVTLEIYGHGSRLCFSQSLSITPQEYSTFLQNLNALGIKHTDEDLSPDGGGEDRIIIQNNDNILFQGVLGKEVIITSNGHIRQVFEPLLDFYMGKVIADPTITLDPYYDNLIT